VSFLNGLGIIDVTDESNPQMVSKVYLGGGFGLDLQGGHAYVAAATKGLQIIDVSDPLSPSIQGFLDTSGSMKDLVVRDGLAYAADGASGLAVIDVSDPKSPSLVGVFDTPGSAESVVLKGDLAFLADGPSGVQVVDVADPEAPVLVGSFETGDMAEEVVVDGDYAYVANASSGLQVLDVSDPASPSLHATFATSGYAKGLAIHGERAFVGNLYDALFQVIDVSNPAVPSELASFRYGFPNESWDVVVEGDRAFIVDYFSGIIITDISDISELEAVGWYETAPFFVGLEVTNDRAYTLGQEYYGYAVLDISDPTDPRFLGKSPTFGDGSLRYPRGIVARDHLGYIAYRGLLIGDLQDPEAPELISQLAVPGIGRTVRVHGDYAYLTSDHSGFYVIDISDMASPTVAGVVEMPGSSYGLALKGDHAFLANSEFGLKVINISDPTGPTLVASLQTPDNGSRGAGYRRLPRTGWFHQQCRSEGGLRVRHGRRLWRKKNRHLQSGGPRPGGILRYSGRTDRYRDGWRLRDRQRCLLYHRFEVSEDGIPPPLNGN
jgi:hypothetical protein